MDNLSKAELQRYARHLALPDFGIAAQRALKNARVLVIGAGGLGAPVLMYLTAAGVGTIGIVDYDRVEVSNLQRQVLFAEQDIGQPKATVAAQKLRGLNPHITIHSMVQRFTKENALNIAADYDIIVDGTDNFPTRYLVNDVCVLLGKVNVYGSIFRYEGQVSVFNLPTAEGGRSPNYRDIFPNPPAPELVPNCAEGGVLGVLPGIIGSIQANEAIKVITGNGVPLAGKLFILDTTTMMTRTIRYTARSDNRITELMDYEQFCGISTPETVNTITSVELEKWLNETPNIRLIDVRQPYERAITHIGGELIPLDELKHTEWSHELDTPIVFYCQTGRRSREAILFLKKKGYAIDHFYNLEGGIEAYKKRLVE